MIHLKHWQGVRILDIWTLNKRHKMSREYMYRDEEQSQQILQKLIIQEWKHPDIMSNKHKINKVIRVTFLKLNIQKN